MVRVVRGLIDGGGKSVFAQDRKCDMVKVVKAIVESDSDSLGRKTSLAEHPQGGVERQYLILAPHQCLHTAAEESGRHVEIAPGVLVLE